MEKKYIRKPFNLELAKKIQSGEIEGRIVTNNGSPVRIICYDRLSKNPFILVGLISFSDNAEGTLSFEYPYMFSVDGECDYPCKDSYHLSIELPEEEPKHKFEPFEKVLVRNTTICNNNSWHATYYSNSIIRKDTRYHVTTAGLFYIDGDIIPYKGNEHLLGTTDKPKEE